MIKTPVTIFAVIAGAVLGSLMTLGVYTTWMSPDAQSGSPESASAEKKPLYWVAPMNPGYKRDKPGKSPMGMDLIPVYESGGGGNDAGPGTIRISPDIVNNLGVRTAFAEIRSLHTQIQTVGYVAYDEDQLVHVHPRVKGWIEKLYVKAAGDPVKRGQALYEIYSPELVNAQEELVLALDRNNERLSKAAEDRLNALQLPGKAIKTLKRTRNVSQTITFYAPQSGVVDNLNIREGFYVKPGTTLMSIGTLEQVWVEAEVFERQSSEVSVGQPVTMTLDFLPGREWQGKVDYIYPTLDAATRTIKVRLRFENQDKVLKPNMFAQVIIHSTNQNDTLLVPREAVIRTGNTNRVVLALGEGRFKSVNVKIGRLDDHSTEILAGLEAGERIVTSAQFLLDSESSKTSDFKRLNHGAADDEMQGMDQGMDQGMKGMDHSMPGMEQNMKGMDHSMPGMDQNMKGMDHSMPGMDQNMKGMDHSMPGMDQNMKGMDHSMPGMDQNMKGMDHDMPGMDHQMMNHEGIGSSDNGE